jgi:hypothetical protein
LGKNEAAEAMQEVAEYEGMNVEIYEVRVPRRTPQGGSGTERWRFIADSESHLPVTFELQAYDPNGDLIVTGEMTFDYPDEGPADIYEMGAPRSAKLIDNRTGREAEEVISDYRAYRRNAPSRYIAVAFHSNRSVRTELTGIDVIDEVTQVYTNGRLQRFEKYQVFDWRAYLDNWLEFSEQMGSTLDSLQKWWIEGEFAGCWLVLLYDGEYNHKIKRDLKTKKWGPVERWHSPEKNNDELGVVDWGWPSYGLHRRGPDVPPTTVVEDEYSKGNDLICLQSLWQGEAHDKSIRWPSKKLWYLDPRRDYICRRFEERYLRNAPWQKDKSWLEGVDQGKISISAESTFVREVTEFGQTEAGQWYPKKIEKNTVPTGLRDGLTRESSSAYTIYVDTEPRFPEGVFDPKNLPKSNE